MKNMEKCGNYTRRCCNLLTYLRSTVVELFRCFYPRGYGALPLVLGFFQQPIRGMCSHPIKYKRKCQQTQFLFTCDKQNADLNEEKWGCLDTSLDFLHQTVYIMASSNGFLLCSTDTKEFKHYIVCNPITKESHQLPETHKPYNYVAMAFICKGDPTCLNRVNYLVVRAGVSNPSKSTTALEIETYSSSTGKWKESTIICASPFYLVVANLPAFFYGEVICWEDRSRCIIAYNPRKNSVELMDMPKDSQKFISCSNLLGKSEGKIQYARCDAYYLEMWVLENFKKGEWIMKYRVALTKISPQITSRSIDIKGFHPTNAKQILISRLGLQYWYNFESGKLDCISASKKRAVYDYFLYEWPSV